MATHVTLSLKNKINVSAQQLNIFKNDLENAERRLETLCSHLAQLNGTTIVGREGVPQRNFHECLERLRIVSNQIKQVENDIAEYKTYSATEQEVEEFKEIIASLNLDKPLDLK